MDEIKSLKGSGWYPFTASKIHRWAYWDGAFSKQDCQDIIDWGIAQNLEQARINGHLGTLDSSYRESSIAWMMPHDFPEVFQKFEHIIKDLNEKCFGFDLTGLGEGLQFTEYKAPEGNYNWHVDAIPLGAIRKLSFSLQLSDPDDYLGGELQLAYRQDDPKHIISLEKKQGMVFVFPSWEVHRVAPVTQGTRYSLVGWVTGPSFK